MNVLIYGSGAREHALAWKISQSRLLNKLYLAIPNDGFSHLGEIINFASIDEFIDKCLKKKIELVIIGPEEPLVLGLGDILEQNGIKVFGANRKWAKLEGSKLFAKEFMERNSIPTSKYTVITRKEHINNALGEFYPPYVIKADGLAAGKGVFIANSRDEAKLVMLEYLDGKFGKSSQKIVLEEFQEGREISLMSIWDGKTLLPMIPACDYKKLADNDKGPNTGGMGSYCPVNLNGAEIASLNNYTALLQKALTKEKTQFKGVLYSGLIMTKTGLKVLEYNVRFGDPEIQSLLLHLENDLLEIIQSTMNQTLDKIDLKWKEGYSGCVVIASKGYPYAPKKGGEIILVDDDLVNVFFAGVKKEDKRYIANGGRVFSVCSLGADIESTFAQIYKTVEKIVFDDKIYRRDIGS